SSGTESTMYTLMLARAYTRRTRFARMEGSYHGTQDTMRTGTDSAVGLPPPEGNSQRVAAGIPPRMGEEVDFLPFNDLEGCAHLIEANARDLAAVFVEPLQGAGGAIPSEPGFLEGLRELCDRHGIVLIFDEMVSLGLAPGGAQAYYG